MISHVNDYSIFKQYQSGFHTHHSTETALIKVTARHWLWHMLNFNPPQLEFSFQCCDDAILLNHHVGIRDKVLNWFCSYFSDRSFSVVMGEFPPSPAPLTCGVPQRSILGPFLFSIYMLPLGQMQSQYELWLLCRWYPTLCSINW